jgi:putative PIN family toxin of toxin-antitoxin system
MQKRSNAVVDTGVLISAFVFGGIPMHAVQKSFKETTVFVSPQLLHEYREVPRALYTGGKINDEQLRSLISGIAAFVSKSKVVEPVKKIDICRDKEDNMLLECCFAAHAEYLITGDKDLLSIDMLPFKLKIVTPRTFVDD